MAAEPPIITPVLQQEGDGEGQGSLIGGHLRLLTALWLTKKVVRWPLSSASEFPARSQGLYSTGQLVTAAKDGS